MKKILSLFLAFSLVVQPAYSVTQAAQPQKKGIITKTKEKWSDMREAISRGQAVLKANWQCITTGKGEGCTKDKHMALKIISNFVTGKTEAAKEGLLVFLKLHRECWAYLFGDILAFMPAALLTSVAYLMLKSGDFTVEEAVAGSLQGLLFSVGILFTYELGSEERRALHQRLTFDQKLKRVGKCMLIIGIDIAIVTALTYIIVTMIKREEGREDVQRLNKNASSFLEKKISEAKDEEEKKLIRHIIYELGKLVHVDEIRDHQHNERPAMLFAAEKGYKAAASILIDARANINVQDKHGDTPLRLAVFKGNEEIAKRLIGAGANLNVQDKEGQTPLHIAVDMGKKEIAKLLIEAGADLNVQDKFDNTPLHLAANYGNKEIVERLIQAKADLNASNVQGYTPLHVAAFEGKKEIVELLIQKGADLQGKYGATPLHLAIFKGNEEIAKRLIEAGVNLNVQDKDGDTPLHIAVNKGKKEIVERLIAVKANLEVQDEQGNTPLHEAVLDGKKEIVELLINAGAKPNQRNKSGNTPLHLAALRRYKEIAELLIQKGADRNIPNDRGLRPVQLTTDLELQNILRPEPQ